MAPALFRLPARNVVHHVAVPGLHDHWWLQRSEEHIKYQCLCVPSDVRVPDPVLWEAPVAQRVLSPDQEGDPVLPHQLPHVVRGRLDGVQEDWARAWQVLHLSDCCLCRHAWRVLPGFAANVFAILCCCNARDCQRSSLIFHPTWGRGPSPCCLHLLPSFPTPEFDQDGVHLTVYSGLEFMIHLFDSSISVTG